MRKFGLLAAVLAAGLVAAPAMGTVTFYLSTVGWSGGTPTPVNPEVTLNLGDSVTWYLWAQTASGTSTAMGINYVETNPAVVTASAVTVWNGIINPNDDPQDPEVPENDWAIYRWNGYGVTTGALGGFSAVGGFNDPQGVNAAGFTTLKRTYGDPTWRGTSPYQWYLGSVTFTATAVGETDIFLTVNDLLLVGNSTLIGTPTTGTARMGAGEAAGMAVSVDGATYYLAAGSTGLLPDAHITVTPEPGSLALLALGGLALIRRR